MNLLLVIRILTYNHESYISNCLESIVAQKTTFRFKAIIGEDCSTDNTALICGEFEKHYPTLIELHCSPFNNLQLNSSNNWEHCINSGAKYIALLEGDDFWIDSLKLQKQVDFLEANPKFSFCCSNIKMIDALGEEISNAWPQKSDSVEISKRSIGLKLPVPTCSLVFRASVCDKKRNLINELKRNPVPDFFLKSFLLTQGKGYFFQEKMAVYRQHPGGIFTRLAKNSQLKTLQLSRRKFIFFCIKQGEWISALICLKNTIKHPNF